MLVIFNRWAMWYRMVVWISMYTPPRWFPGGQRSPSPTTIITRTGKITCVFIRTENWSLKQCFVNFCKNRSYYFIFCMFTAPTVWNVPVWEITALLPSSLKRGWTPTSSKIFLCLMLVWITSKSYWYLRPHCVKVM